MRGPAIAIAVGVPLALAAAAGVLAGLSPSGGAAAVATTASATPTPSPTASPAEPAPSPSQSATASTSASATADPYVAAMSGGSETLQDGQSERTEENLSDSNVEILNWVETDDPVYFITIDDGLSQPEDALALIEERQIPVTAFLTEYAVRDYTDYFTGTTAYGGSIQNHTMVHGALNDPETDVKWEICETQDRFEGQFGTRPWMLRPPYGAGPNDPDVLRYAEKCGINRIVLWNVVVSDDNKVEYWDAPLRPGDIVLLHWNDNLAANLETLLQLGEEQGLSPAPLENYI